MADSIEEAVQKIGENALAPKKISTEAGSVEQHDLGQQIEYLRLIQSQKAANSQNLGIRILKIRADGAT